MVQAATGEVAPAVVTDRPSSVCVTHYGIYAVVGDTYRAPSPAWWRSVVRLVLMFTTGRLVRAMATGRLARAMVTLSSLLRGPGPEHGYPVAVYRHGMGRVAWMC